MKIAIVGAGVSGLSAAYFLLEKFPDATVTVFEKTPAVGGRMATRRLTNDVSIDTGCQFLSIDDDILKEFFFKVAPRESLRELPSPILCLPEGWLVEPTGRFYFLEGMTVWNQELLRLLRERSSRFAIQFDSKIHDCEALWREGFDVAFVTAPGPQAEELGCPNVSEYKPCLSLTFSWNDPPVETAEIFAYRDTSGRPGITWLAHEGLKRGQPEIWIAQASPEATLAWYPDNRTPSLDELEDHLARDLEAWVPLFGRGSKTLLDAKLWRHAFPEGGLDPTRQEGFTRREQDDHCVYYIGDGHLGVGRVENAIESARRAVDDFSAAATTEAQPR